MENDFNVKRNEEQKVFFALANSFKHLALTTCLLLAIILFLFIFNFNTSSPSENQPTAPKKEIVKLAGEPLFKSNCSSCHAFGRNLIGPDLTGISSKRDKEWLHKWIKNNVALRASGDKDAIAIYEEYNGAPMNTFLHLTEDDIDQIIVYIDSK